MEALDTLYSGSQTLEDISRSLDQIIENGVGYDDSIGAIAIPLLIALFAFAFPFLFSVITHINSKYDSEPISQMFSKGCPYRTFLGMSLLSAIILVVVAFFSLVLSGGWHHVFVIIACGLLIVAAAAYSVTILWFVKTCITYNTPTDIPELIEQQYRRDMEEAEEKLADLERKMIEINKIKDEYKRGVRLQGLMIGKQYSKYDAKQSRVNRYADLCCYAVRKGNNTLFNRILLRMADIAKEEKKLPEDENLYHVNSFYTGVVSKIRITETDSSVDETLLSYWFNSFSRNHQPWMRAIVDMMTNVIESAQRGHTGLLEHYVKEASGGFGFIRRVPQVAFVKGGSIEEQTKLEEEVGFTWNSLVEIHYFVAAYLFSMHYYQAVKILLMEANRWHAGLYPSSPAECLAWYAQCKIQQDESGEFHTWYSNLIAREIADPDLLESFTVFRLLMTKEVKIPAGLTIGDRDLQIIKEGKEKIQRTAEFMQHDLHFVSFFPTITKLDFGRIFNDSLNALEETMYSPEAEKRGGWLHRMIAEWCPSSRDDNRSSIYRAELSDELKVNITTMVDNILHVNQGAITRHLIGEDDGTKTCVMNLGMYSFKLPKRLLLDLMARSGYGLFNDITFMFNARYQFLMLEAIKIMGSEVVRISPDNFESYFCNLLVGNENAYALISINSPMSAFLKYDNHIEKDYSYKQTYHGAEVHQIDIDTSWYLRDLSEVDEFRHTLLIMRKKDLPVMESVIKEKRCEVKFEDLSNMDTGVAEVRMNIDSNLRMCYDRHAKVIKLVTEKIEL